uniref:Uncharacterized protein n=1 Tax=viral metagenome TaxID=1070528 RepID=A0A6C0B912_9ZZZZ
MDENDTSERIKKIEKLLHKNLDEYNNMINETFIEGKNVDLGPIGSINIPDIDDIKRDIKDGIIGPLTKGINKDLIKPLNKTIKDSVKTFTDLINNMIAGIQKGVNGFFDILSIVVNFINETAARFIQMGKGMNDIFTGLFVTETKGLGEGLKLGFTNIGELLQWSGEFIFSYITCSVQYIQNLHRCLFFYCTDTFAQILYLPIRILLWFMKTFLFRDLYPLEQKAWDLLEQADQFIFYYVGVHISHYPKNIRDLCYNCKRMKVDALKDKVKQINYGFSRKMPQLLQAGIGQMQDGSKQFAGAFSSNFKIPAGAKPPIDPKSLKAPEIPTIKFSVGDVVPEINI